MEPTPGRNARLIVPPLVKAGEEFSVRLLIQHPMETGFRRDVNGDVLPANILESLSMDFEGTSVFVAHTMNALTANPSLTFLVTIKKSGAFNARWKDMQGNAGSISASVRVAGA